MSSKKKRSKREVVGFVGIGLDNKDDQQRISQSDYFFLIGGSAETHGAMQDTAIRFEEALERKGKKLNDTSVEEALDMLRAALDR